MKLIIHERLSEESWFRWLLGELVDEVVMDPDYRVFAGPQIQVISGNQEHLRTRESFLRQSRAVSEDLTLLHASDEWFSGGYALYRHVDRVIRTHDTWLAKAPGILTIPLGYPEGSHAPAIVPCASERPYLWSFAGQVKASRMAMVAALSSVEPGCLVDTCKSNPLAPAEYQSLLWRTLFLPCPMGNVMAETWRLYEGLEFGCIPIVEKRWSIDYYQNLLGDAPFLRVATWQEAARTIRELAEDSSELVRLQQQVIRWWRAKKQEVKDEVARFMRTKSHQADLARFARLYRNVHPPIFAGMRLVELLRHQSPGSLARRLAQPAGPLRRIGRDLR
jgi:hypothetical protein